MAQDIGYLYKTSIPELTENADIQAALRLYHYGTPYDPDNQLESGINPNSIAGMLKTLSARVTNVEDSGVGSLYSSTEPESPADGFIWMDADDSLGAMPGLIAAYQTSAPSNPVTGTLWVDSTDTNALSLKVYDGTTWKVII
jgi:hypothetical protein